MLRYVYPRKATVEKELLEIEEKLFLRSVGQAMLQGKHDSALSSGDIPFM